MPEAYKILGQLAPSDTTENVLYTSPANTQTIVNNIVVANRSASAQTFDISIYNSIVSNGTTSPALNNLYKNATIAANSFQILEPGVILNPQNSIVIKGNSSLTFSSYGVEIS
jgi:hypothetical protein